MKNIQLFNGQVLNNQLPTLVCCLALVYQSFFGGQFLFFLLFFPLSSLDEKNSLPLPRNVGHKIKTICLEKKKKKSPPRVAGGEVIIPSGFIDTSIQLTPFLSLWILLCLQKHIGSTRGLQTALRTSSLNYSAMFTVSLISLRCDGPPSAPVSSSSQLHPRFDRPHVLSAQPLMKCLPTPH